MTKPMSKTALKKLAKTVCPKDWIVQDAYGMKETHGQAMIVVFGCPIDERMEHDRKMSRNIKAICKEMNKDRKRGEPKWEEFGGGFGGGKWYDVEIGVEMPHNNI